MRIQVIPQHLSVKKAAEILQIGRPALSRFLNGKASLSPEMADRLARAFGANRADLLELQTQYDQAIGKGVEASVAVRNYVPSFLEIGSQQLEIWAERPSSRLQLPVLLRKLIHSTGRELKEVDFPGNDEAERKGWDGIVEAGVATPWIPLGSSRWEFGCSQDPKQKADKDYSARTQATPAAERVLTTFVFVTPRRWPGKTKWVKQKATAGEWKEVKAFDASDIEQWLEQSIPTQAWIAEKLELPTTGFSTLERFWENWADASAPAMSPMLFAPSIAHYRETFLKWFGDRPSRPLLVAADSRGEALAFLACLFDDPIIAKAFPKDIALVLESSETMRRISTTSSRLIPIVSSLELERELTSTYRTNHCIVVRPRNAVDSEPDLAVDLLSDEAFETALRTMGISKDRIDSVTLESARSPTILRRRLSPIDAIKRPQWAEAESNARALIPITLSGAWHHTSSADREVLSLLSGSTYSTIEQAMNSLFTMDDSPVWSTGQYRGVMSKIDALFAVAKYITSADLEAFFLAAEYVLSESDPALELPEDKRYLAGVYGKVREHSGALRQGICETLVLLSLFGNALLRERLGLNLEFNVADLIRRLLTPLTVEKLISHSDDLMRYAEAAPQEFLRVIEKDLESKEPVVLELLKPASSGIFGTNCLRTQILWALECLAWNPLHLPRVTRILARLCEKRIEDNWVNKPANTLDSIYRCWMPQTAAPIQERIAGLEMLVKRFPEVGWELCVSQFDRSSRMGTYNYRPKWRNDAAGAGQPVSNKEQFTFARRALDLALAWPNHDEKTLGELIDCMAVLPKKDQDAIWALVDTWAGGAADDPKATLRERIRRAALTRGRDGTGERQHVIARAREAYEKLTPSDPVARNIWLFADYWVRESHEELLAEESDLAKREERIAVLRKAALKEVFDHAGIDDVFALAKRSKVPFIVGYHALELVGEQNELRQFIASCLKHSEPDVQIQMEGCLQGLLTAMNDDSRRELLLPQQSTFSPEEALLLLKLAPFKGETWKLVTEWAEPLRTQYWREIQPTWSRQAPDGLNELIDRLLEVERPRAAFHVAHLDWENVETSRLKRLLRAVGTSDSEPTSRYQFSEYEVSAALDSLAARMNSSIVQDDSARGEVATAEMAELELLFIRVLEHSSHGIPNLEKMICKSPLLFVQALALAFRRIAAGEDPPEWRIADAEKRAAAAQAAYQLLENLRRIPGTPNTGGPPNRDELEAWVLAVRRFCEQYGRVEMGDHYIGHVLSHSPTEEGGMWPCRPVCEVLEATPSESVLAGFRVAVYNSRGVTVRGEGGDQERTLAKRYRGYADRVRSEFQFVSRILDSIADCYDHDAYREDSEATIRRRLLHR